jgi:hypothetical protein
VDLAEAGRLLERDFQPVETFDPADQAARLQLVPEARPGPRPEERCRHPKRHLLEHGETGHFAYAVLRCNKSSCPGCLALKKRLDLERVGRRLGEAFDRAGTMHYLRVPAEKRPAVLRQVSRLRKAGQGGAYYATRLESGEIEVLTTAPLPGADALDREQAQATLRDMVRDAAPDAGKKRSAFGRGGGGWQKAAEPKGEAAWRMLDRQPTLVEEEFRAVGERHGFQVIDEWRAEGPLARRLVIPCDRADPRRPALLAALCPKQEYGEDAPFSYSGHGHARAAPEVAEPPRPRTWADYAQLLQSEFWKRRRREAS